MSLSVSYNQTAGIDSKALREVTQQIFQRAEAKSGAVSNNTQLINFAKKADLGLDLYNGRVDTTTAKQIAMANAGMQIQMNSNLVSTINFLNTQAAVKNVEGKFTIAVNEQANDSQKTGSFAKFNTVVKSASSDNEKNGSNPFYKGELLNTKKEEEKDENLNLVA